MAATQMISTDRKRALVGMGATGRSVARYLSKKGLAFKVFDTRPNPPGVEEFEAEYPEATMHLGPVSADAFAGCDEVILSPGVAPNQGVFVELEQQGVALIGDIELFAREVKKPVIAITGSNAKSTVTTLVGLMATAEGLNAGIGGNLGTPALDLIADERDLYVLELSSFQLETTQGLKASVSCVLNISADHLDRHGSMMAYHRIKQRIYTGAKSVVCNRQDPLTIPLLSTDQSAVTFGVNWPDLEQFGVVDFDGEQWLSRGVERLFPVSKLGMRGRHNVANALAALAIGTEAGFTQSNMFGVLQEFSGLTHRCQWVAEIAGVDWINDSKATNVGATVAAVDGFSTKKNVILIAGGQAKGQTFEALANVIGAGVKQLVLIGEDAAKIEQALSAQQESSVSVVYAVNMAAAVKSAEEVASEGDVVLLSPACASHDMFTGYEARGDAFMQEVHMLEASS